MICSIENGPDLIPYLQGKANDCYRILPMDIDNVDNEDLVGDADLDGESLDDLLGDEIVQDFKVSNDLPNRAPRTI